MMSEIFEWFRTNETLAWWLGAASIAMFVGTLIAIPVAVALMPCDYFVPTERRSWLQRAHPALRWPVRIVKNLAGVVFLLAGIFMLALPGQGLLSILLGVVLLDFPGKHRLERSMVRRKPIHRAMNWIRRKAGRDEIIVPEKDDD